MKFKQFLSEARTVAGEAAAKRGLTHVGHGYYADRTGQIVAKSEGGERLVTVSRDEAEQATASAENGAVEQEGNDSVNDLGNIAITFGRFNPPTVGHEKLLSKVAESSQGGEYRIYPSRTVDAKKNPLEPAEKINYLKKMFPDHADAIQNDPDKGNIFNVLSSINEEGYSSVTMVVGSDRVAEFNDLLQKYNGQAYNFEELKVVSGGQRDPDAEGVEGMSASKMRAFAAEGNLEDFAKGIPGKDEGVAKRLMDAVRKGMGIQEKEDVEIKELWQIAPKLDLQNLREAYVRKSIFDIGTVVEHLDTGVQGKIVHRGTNYAIFEDGNGWRFRCWLTSLNEVKEKHHSADDGSGNDWKIGTDTYRQAVQAMTPGQSVKKFSDFRKSK